MYDFKNDVFDPFSKSVFYFIKGMVKDKMDAEDLTMIAFEKIAKKLSTFIEKDAALKTWVFVVAKNTVIDHWRKNRNKMETFNLYQMDDETGVESEMFSTDDNDPLKDLIIKETIENAKKILSELPELDSKVANLYFIAQYKYDEIVSELDIPLGTVKNKIFKIKKLLSERRLLSVGI